LRRQSALRERIKMIVRALQGAAELNLPGRKKIVGGKKFLKKVKVDLKS